MHCASHFCLAECEDGLYCVTYDGTKQPVKIDNIDIFKVWPSAEWIIVLSTQMTWHIIYVNAVREITDEICNLLKCTREEIISNVIVCKFNSLLFRTNTIIGIVDYFYFECGKCYSFQEPIDDVWCADTQIRVCTTDKVYKKDIEDNEFVLSNDCIRDNDSRLINKNVWLPDPKNLIDIYQAGNTDKFYSLVKTRDGTDRSELRVYERKKRQKPRNWRGQYKDIRFNDTGLYQHAPYPDNICHHGQYFITTVGNKTIVEKHPVNSIGGNEGYWFEPKIFTINNSTWIRQVSMGYHTLILIDDSWNVYICRFKSNFNLYGSETLDRFILPSPLKIQRNMTTKPALHC